MNAIETAPNRQAVLRKALFRVQNALGLTQQEIGRILGCSTPKVVRLKAESTTLTGKEEEAAAILIRIARALYALTGDDADWTHHFMRSYNKMTEGVPAEQIQTLEGLIKVLHYVDAIRGKV